MSEFGTWEQILPELLSVFSAIGVRQVPAPGGVFNHAYPEWKAAWKDRREAADFINPRIGAQLLLKFTSCVPIGWDDWDTTELSAAAATALGYVVRTDENDDPLPADTYQTLSGIRKFVIQAQFWITEEMDTLNGMLLMERLKTRMDASYARSRLLAVNVDFTDVAGSRDMTAEKDGMKWSVVSCDFTFCAAIIETEPNPVGWIETVIMTSHEQQNGVDVQPSLRQIDETLPPE